MLHECELPISYLISTDEDDANDMVDSTVIAVFSYSPAESAGPFYPGCDEQISLEKLLCQGLDILPLLGDEDVTALTENLLQIKDRSGWAVHVDDSETLGIAFVAGDEEDTHYTIWLTVECGNTSLEMVISLDVAVIQNLGDKQVTAMLAGPVNLKPLFDAQECQKRLESNVNHGNKNAPN